MCDCDSCTSQEYEVDYAMEVICPCGFSGEVEGTANGRIGFGCPIVSGHYVPTGSFWYFCPDCGKEREVEEVSVKLAVNND